MGGSSHGFDNPSSSLIPTPIVNIHDMVLQHNRRIDFNSFINISYAKSNVALVDANLGQTGAEWCRYPIKVGISLVPSDSYQKFLENKPMIFMQVYAHKQDTRKTSKDVNNNVTKTRVSGKGGAWINVPNPSGTLNRSHSNFNNGIVPSGWNQQTEWDLTVKDFQEQIIDIIPQEFYVRQASGMNALVPCRWVEWQTQSCYLRFLHKKGIRTDSGGGTQVVTTYTQPIRFQFGYIGEDGRTVLLGNPSKTLYLKPKWGKFNPDQDTFMYDWELTHGK